MDTLDVVKQSYEFFRKRTLGLLDTIEKLPDPRAALAWRPAGGRAHIGWQLMHIGVTEEIFATERLAPSKPARLQAVWPRFRGGSTPDDNVPTPAEIREALEIGRSQLLATLAEFSEDRLGEIPPPLAERKFTIRDVMHLVAWHEAHHQGQAHITLNLFKALQHS